MPASLLVVALVANLPVDASSGERAVTSLQMSHGAHWLDLAFRDAEEALLGTLEPERPQAGEPVTLTLVVDPLAGPPFRGPVTVTLRPLEAMDEPQVVTVTPEGRAWHAVITPPHEGEYRLEIAWRSTRLKAARGRLPVGPAALPWWVPPTVGISLIVVASAGGAWFLLRRQEKNR